MILLPYNSILLVRATFLTEICIYLEKDKGHHTDKLKNVAMRFDNIKQMNTIINMNKDAVEKFKKLLAQHLWEEGLVDGKFKMDRLTGIIMTYAKKAANAEMRM